jgi:diacylglycerol kinase (CTP)
MAKAAHYDETAGFYETVNNTLRDLHTFITSVNCPRLLDRTWTERKRNYSQELSDRISRMHVFMDEKKKTFDDSFSTSLTQIQVSLQKYSQELKDRPNGHRLKALFEELSGNYEELLTNLKKRKITKIKALHLKPVNYVRNIFHILCGTTCVLLYQFLLNRETALWLVAGFLLAAIGMEVSRRFSGPINDFLVDKLFGAVSRPHERHKANGSTCYVIAIFILALFFVKPVALLSILVLAFADPAASIVGKLWGRRKLFKEKSFLGTATFFGTALTVVLIYLTLAVPSFSFGYALLVAAVVSLASTTAELFSVSVDDNLSIPLVSALAAFMFF